MAAPTKKKPTLSQAAANFKRAKKLETQAKALRDEADPILKSYFVRTGKTAYKGIGYSVTTQRRLSVSRVREYLGTKAKDFEELIERTSLSLLGDGGE